MDRESGDKAFRWLAIGMMVVTAVSTAVHAVRDVMRDVRSRREGREQEGGAWRSHPSREEFDYQLARGEVPYQEEEIVGGGQWRAREEARGRYRRHRER